jgi:hypothetical protein
LDRDPEARARKAESLKKRYLLRRIDPIDDDGLPSSGGEMYRRTRSSVERKLGEVSDSVAKLANVLSIERDVLGEIRVGNNLFLKDLIHSIQSSSPQSSVIVVRDRGNTERLLKVLRRELPQLKVRLMDRERIELLVPAVTPELREERGEKIDRLITTAKKELKKLELQAYDELKKSGLSDRDILTAREAIRGIFTPAENALDSSLETAMEKLDIDFR